MGHAHLREYVAPIFLNEDYDNARRLMLLPHVSLGCLSFKEAANIHEGIL